MIGQRLVLRRQLRQLGRVDKDARTVLRDEDMFETLLSSDDLRAEAYGNTVQGLQDWLDWLIENQDQLLALVKKIIELFSSFTSVTTAEEPAQA